MRRPRSTTDHDACDVVNEDDDDDGGDRDEDINKDAERGRGGGRRKVRPLTVIDYSLNRPCRTLSAMAPSFKASSRSGARGPMDDDDDDDDGRGGGDAGGGHGRDDDDDDDDGGDRINRLHLLTYREYDHELIESSSYVHPSGEIWSMACHPTRSEYVVTCGGGGTMYHPEDIYENDDDGGGSRKNAGGGQGRDCR